MNSYVVQISFPAEPFVRTYPAVRAPSMEAALIVVESSLTEAERTTKRSAYVRRGPSR